MKIIFKLFSLSLLMVVNLAYGQMVNYQKLGVPSVDGGGKVFDADKNPIGRVDKDGTIFNAQNEKVAKFDAFSNIIEEGTGENFGKSDPEGNHLIVAKKKVVSWKSNHPENAGIQICLIKDKNGKIVGAVNKVHKQYGTGALYYLVSKYVKVEESETVAEAPTKSKVKSGSKAKTKAKSAATKKKTVKKKTKK